MPIRVAPPKATPTACSWLSAAKTLILDGDAATQAPAPPIAQPTVDGRLLNGRRLRLRRFGGDLGGLLLGHGLRAVLGLVLRRRRIFGLGRFIGGLFGGLAATAAALLGLLGLERFGRRRRQLGDKGEVEREDAEQCDRGGSTIDA